MNEDSQIYKVKEGEIVSSSRSRSNTPPYQETPESSSGHKSNQAIEQPQRTRNSSSIDPSSTVIHPRIIIFFKNILKGDKTAMRLATESMINSKSVFLTLVNKHSDKIQCGWNTVKTGPPQGLYHRAEVVLRSKEYGNVIIKVEGTSKQKRQAEADAFYKLANILYK